MSLKHLLLHEIGHVFGMQHNTTWVMDSEVMHDLLWATLRHKFFHSDVDELVPLGSIETDFMPFDPLSGAHDLKTCAGFNCGIENSAPKLIQEVLALKPSAGKENPEIRIRFSERPQPNQNPVNAPMAPIVWMTIKCSSLAIEKTINLQPQTIDDTLVPRFYLSGAYNPDVAFLRRVYYGNFTAALSGNGITVPLFISVGPKQFKISAFDSATGAWTDWVSNSVPYIKNPKSASQGPAAKANQ